MLIDVHVQRQAALSCESKQKIEEGQWVVGVLRNTAYDVSAGGYCRLKPLPTGVEFPRCVARQMRDDLQGNTVAVALAQIGQSFNAADVALGFDVGVAANRDGAVRDTLFNSAFGTCGDLFARGRSREGAISRGRTRERCLRVPHEPPRVRLVEMLVGVNQARQDKLTVEVDSSLRCALGDIGLNRHDAAVRTNGHIETLQLFNVRALHAAIAEKKRNAAHGKNPKLLKSNDWYSCFSIRRGKAADFNSQEIPSLRRCERSRGLSRIEQILPRAIYAGAHNAYLREQAAVLYGRVVPYRAYQLKQPEALRLASEEHKAIVYAIVAGDGDKAHRLLVDHVSLSNELFADLVSALNIADAE
jgi:FCD domain